MKKLMMIAAMMLMSMGAFAQNEVGQFTLKPMVGMTLPNITNYDGKIKVGFAAGVEAEYGITETFGVSGGVLYSMEGSKNKDNSDFKTNLDYINVPILANAYLFKGFAVKVGVQPGFLVRAKEKYSNGGITVDGDIKDACNKVQLSIPIGLSYEYANFVLDARYNWGLTNTFKNDNSDKKSHNSVFMFTLGYKFAL
jgi:predicted porin